MKKKRPGMKIDEVIRRLTAIRKSKGNISVILSTDDDVDDESGSVYTTADILEILPHENEVIIRRTLAGWYQSNSRTRPDKYKKRRRRKGPPFTQKKLDAVDLFAQQDMKRMAKNAAIILNRKSPYFDLLKKI